MISSSEHTLKVSCVIVITILLELLFSIFMLVGCCTKETFFLMFPGCCELAIFNDWNKGEKIPKPSSLKSTGVRAAYRSALQEEGEPRHLCDSQGLIPSTRTLGIGKPGLSGHIAYRGHVFSAQLYIMPSLYCYPSTRCQIQKAKLIKQPSKHALLDTHVYMCEVENNVDKAFIMISGREHSATECLHLCCADVLFHNCIVMHL